MKHKHYFAAITSAALLLTGCQKPQTAAPGQSSTTTAASSVHDSSTQTLTETQPISTDNTSLTNIVSCDQIRLPDDISGFTTAERTADGFGCIVYNNDGQLTYLHISDDMQTSESFILTPPTDPEKYFNSYRCFAFDEGEFWTIVIPESNEGLVSYDQQTDGDLESRNEGEQDQYLLCRYADNGTLISAIPANELKDHQITDSFECAGGSLYITLRDDRILQIDKGTAKISAVLDLSNEDDSYNDKFLCFDRDDKPVLLKEKVTYAPDSHIINEATVSEFDIASGSCGQTIYTTGDNWDQKRFSVLKGCGEYRLFINTYSELIGIRDDGTQDVLIDIDASELNIQSVPDMYDIKIVPFDDTKFLELYEYGPYGKTAAFCLTRKHGSEIG